MNKTYSVYNEYIPLDEEREVVEELSRWATIEDARTELTRLVEELDPNARVIDDMFEDNSPSNTLESDIYYIMEWEVQSHG